MKKLAWAAVVASFLSTPSFAADLSVSDVWARASAGMARAGAAFMTITNQGSDDKLIAAKANVSQRVELHTHLKENGIMRMREVKNIPTPKGATMLQPGGYHVMFMSLNEPLKEGQTFPLTLVFEKSGEITVDVQVKTAGAMGMGHGQMKQNMQHKMDMKK